MTNGVGVSVILFPFATYPFESSRASNPFEHSIPVTIDSVKTDSSFKFVRCDYFTFECETPSPGWILDLDQLHVPFLLTSLSGIIYRPSSDESFFSGSDQIEKLFDFLEDKGGLIVGTSDIWLPSSLVKKTLASASEVKLQRGVTVRVSLDLFQLAMAYRTEALSQKQFEEETEEMKEAVSFIEKENAAFRSWRIMQRELAIKQYPKNKDMQLKWTGKQDGFKNIDPDKPDWKEGGF
jgi:hypothetical protein